MKYDFLNIIGLMTGTSVDGIDISLVQTNGLNLKRLNKNYFYKYSEETKSFLMEMLNEDININLKRKQYLDEFITNEHYLALKDLDIIQMADIIGFHGQTIFHNSEQKISKQLGDGKLMSQLVKKKIIYNFRQEDMINKGQGAPLTPIFHNLLSKKINENHQIDFPICFLNIGGISNITKIIKKDEKLEENLEAFDSGPGNCMIDEWVRKNSKNNFDESGSIAKSGKINQLILN